MASNGSHRFSAHREPFVFQKQILRGPKTTLATIDQLKQYAALNMKKYICILAGAALLAACEQKTETVAPAATPAPTTPPAATEMTSPAETEAPATTTESPAESSESPAQSPGS
jgi:cell division septation protein DedD